MKVHPENVLVYSVVQKTQKTSKNNTKRKNVYIRFVHYLIRCGYMAVTCQGFQNTK